MDTELPSAVDNSSDIGMTQGWQVSNLNNGDSEEYVLEDFPSPLFSASGKQSTSQHPFEGLQPLRELISVFLPCNQLRPLNLLKTRRANIDVLGRIFMKLI